MVHGRRETELAAGERPIPPHAFHALTRASSLIVEGLTEEQSLPRLAQCARDLTGANFCAIYISSSPQPGGGGPYRLAGNAGGNREVLEFLPAGYGNGGGLLSHLLAGGRELRERDLLDGAPADAPLPPHFPCRSLVGIPIRRRDGRAVGALLAGAPEADAFSEWTVTGLRAIAQHAAVALDISRLTAAQQRERRMAAESAVTLGTVLESVGSGVCVVDLDGTMRLANKALQDMFGLTARSTGLSQEEVFRDARFHPSEFETFLGRLRELINDPSVIDESEWELASDPPRIIQRHAAPMRNLLGEVVGRVEVYTDITEGRRLYTQLLHSEKLRVMGEMAAGVAHDFNNLLASIVGQTELLHPEEQSHRTRQAIGTIRQAALDGARLVRHLQGYARAQTEQPTTSADVNETVQQAAEMARPRWEGARVLRGNSIDLVLDLTGKQVCAAVDPSELREVLLNLLFNAADAMPEGGRLEVSARASEAGVAEIRVRDTGQGIPPAIQERIFEPFFSTKGAKGSGLGLAVSYSIITRHGGSIKVSSEPGQGTTFVITLPLAPNTSQEPASVPQADASFGAKRPGGVQEGGKSLDGVRVLVVDDEPGLLLLVRQLLERVGARVETAEGGAAALMALKNSSAAYDVIVTDLGMPEVDGWQVAGAAKAGQPQRPVVMLTGWAGELSPAEFTARGVDLVLAKPCSRLDLEQGIRRLLPAKEPKTSTQPPGTDPLSILVVEDDPNLARNLSDLLGLYGHEVTLAESAEDALSVADQRAFDVVLTDYALGTTTGGYLAEALQARPQKPFVVLITGYATSVDDAAFLTPGVSAVLPKPYRGKELQQILSRVR